MKKKQRLESAAAMTRRSFLASAAAVAGSLAAGPACATRGRPRPPSPSTTVNVGVIGVGGRGVSNLQELVAAGANIVALCDCDRERAAESFKAYSSARQHADWRRMLEQQKDLDAVLVCTPDHTHAAIAMAAMRQGKHVYCEKPLAHSIWEARELTATAASTGMVTQMGTQGHAYEGTRRAVEVMRAGALGDVTELHVWTDRPAGWWPQGITRPTDTPPVPETLDWDLWLGPAPERSYHPAYVPFKWRGFWDFGTGAIGDMGIHTLDTAFWGLELGAPVRAEVRECSPPLGDPALQDTGPVWSIIDLHFPARGNKPPVKMTWYDGGKLPPPELFQGERLIGRDGGSLVIGSKGTLFTRTWNGGQTEADMFVLLPRERFRDYTPPAPTLPRTTSHHREWLDAIRGEGATQSPFAYAAVLTEALLVGNLALRTGQAIEWDAAAMRVTNNAEAARFVRPEFRPGWL